ncbi:hypothetical protein D3C81_1852530 [compost metagenome]
MAARPAVSWEWMNTGSDCSAFSALTSSPVANGVNRPAMSLIATESQPMASICLACFTKASMVCTGLVV